MPVLTVWDSPYGKRQLATMLEQLGRLCVRRDRGGQGEPTPEKSLNKAGQPATEGMNLGLFPVVVGSSKLYQVTHNGFVIDYWGGFTTIIDVQKDSQGRLYVMEFSSAAGFPDVGQGRIIRIANGTAEEIVRGLNVPTAMALDRHDDIYVSDLGAAPGTAGRILRLANPISGLALTTIEVRKPAPLNRGNGVDDDN
jgi:hypothetical protein